MTFATLMLGAYAMAPADPADEESFYAGVAGLGIRGVELALPLEGAASLEPSWFARNIRPDWDLLMTCIPTVMGRLSGIPAYGLASADDDARAVAVADAARARDLALRLADSSGRRRVVGIQVHSAPGPEAGSKEALLRSLDEIGSWDLAGAELLLEHCDALIPGQRAAKGFLSLADETEIVRAAGGTAAGLGLSINWGRSAIEGRSTATAVDHVRSARAAGLLRAVVFSGATETESPWGDAWGDTHIPPSGEGPAYAASSASLLGPSELAETLQASGPVDYLAIKVSVRPKDSGVTHRLAVARAALTAVDAAQLAHGRAEQVTTTTGTNR